MKPYGYTRKDKLECEYGCCTFKGGRHKKCRKIIDRIKRKTARQISLSNIKEEVLYEHD